MDMSMSSTMSMDSMASMTSMAPSATSSMSSMDMSSMSDSMSMMSMTFFTATTTPLYSTAWTPSSTGQYAGTCIFLIALAVTLRCIVALKSVLEMHVWHTVSMHQFHGLDNAHSAKQESLGQAVKHTAAPWRLKVDGVRAVLDMVLVGIGYLLMLAVMTFNVGYFLSVLAGSFLGSLLVGRFATMGTIC